jgi:hypothetical protein
MNWAHGPLLRAQFASLYREFDDDERMAKTVPVLVPRSGGGLANELLVANLHRFHGMVPPMARRLGPDATMVDRHIGHVGGHFNRSGLRHLGKIATSRNRKEAGEAPERMNGLENQVGPSKRKYAWPDSNRRPTV